MKWVIFNSPMDDFPVAPVLAKNKNNLYLFGTISEDSKHNDIICEDSEDNVLYNVVAYLDESESSLPEGSSDDLNELMPETKEAIAKLADKHNKADKEFVEKHLAVIMDKTLDVMIVTHIEKMFGGLQMASVQHFLETGKVTGSLYLAIKELAKTFAANWHNTASHPTPSSPSSSGEEAISRQAWQSWEDDQKTNPNGVNPHAYAYGYKAGYAAMDSYAASLIKENEELKRKISTYHGVLIERDEYFEIIKELVELKMQKDSVGKTENYLLRQPLAWKAAFDAIQEKH